MKKLFYDSAYIRTFEAKVLSCEKGKKGYGSGPDRILSGRRRTAI